MAILDQGPGAFEEELVSVPEPSKSSTFNCSVNADIATVISINGVELPSAQQHGHEQHGFGIGAPTVATEANEATYDSGPPSMDNIYETPPRQQKRHTGRTEGMQWGIGVNAGEW